MNKQISQKVLFRAAESLVFKYNEQYEAMNYSQRYFAFIELHDDLKELGFLFLLSNAFGDKELRCACFKNIYNHNKTN